MPNGPWLRRPPPPPRPQRWKTGSRRRSVTLRNVSPRRGRTWPPRDAARATPRRPSGGPGRPWIACRAHDDLVRSADGRQLAVQCPETRRPSCARTARNTGKAARAVPSGPGALRAGGPADQLRPARATAAPTGWLPAGRRRGARRRAIADALDLDRFAVLGRSGGGPHALACAALLPDRVTRAGVLVSLAPWAAEGLDWFAGMADSNVREFTVAATEPDVLAATLCRPPPRSRPTRPGTSRARPGDAGGRPAGGSRRRHPALLARNFAEALRDSAAGWIDDALGFLRAVGVQSYPTSRSRCCSGTARTTCSRRRRTPAGWPTRSRARSMRSGRAGPLRRARSGARRPVLADQAQLISQRRITSAGPPGRGSAVAISGSATMLGWSSPSAPGHASAMTSCCSRTASSVHGRARAARSRGSPGRRACPGDAGRASSCSRSSVSRSRLSASLRAAPRSCRQFAVLMAQDKVNG